MLKRSKTAEHVKVTPAVEALGGQRELRFAVVGRDQRQQGVGLQRLPALGKRRKAVSAAIAPGAAAGERQIVGQIGPGGYRHLGGQIGEVLAV